MATGLQYGNKINVWAWLNNLTLGNDIAILTNAGAPTSGTSGTGAKKAGPGCLLIDTTNKNIYMNTNTKVSPTWTLLLRGATFSGDATVSAAGVVTLANTTIKTSTTLLTNAQVKALRATPITVVAAPGAGFIVYPIAAWLELVYGGTNAFTSAAADNLALKWKDSTGVALLTGGLQAFLQGTASAFNNLLPNAIGSDVNVLKSVADNQPLVIHNISASEIAGNAGADNTLNLVVKYAIHPTL